MYIRKKDEALACALAQKEYDLKFLSAVIKKKNFLEKILNDIDKNDISKTYEDLSDIRKKLVTPYILSDEEFIKEWQDVEYEGNNYEFGTQEIYTEKGERVRSKSEKILADKFYMMDIPYRYEYPLKLKENKIIYPDFMLLNKRTRKEYYLEHFGIMDNPTYCENAIRKIDIYNRNGIIQGDTLITTFETSNNPLNIRDFENVIKKYLL